MLWRRAVLGSFSAMRATRGALGTDFCYGCGGDTLLQRERRWFVSLSLRGASGSGTFDWLVVRCGGEHTRSVVTGGRSGGSTR